MYIDKSLTAPYGRNTAKAFAALSAYIIRIFQQHL
jgi:hypothetical protein